MRILYEENLANRNIMFVYGSPNFPKFFEVSFYPGNFLHLTGVKLKDRNMKSAGSYKSIFEKHYKDTPRESYSGISEGY